MKKTIFSLALGTFGLGMAEFGIMGVLPDMAHDVGISIPAAGNMIAWYAFGVVIGAPIMALLSSRFSLKSVMLFLAGLCILGNTLFTFSSSYAMLALGRLVSGFPHGAFFGVGAIILSKIAPPGKVTAAVAGMIGGMTIANLVGVPGGTWLGHHFSWRYTFALIAVFNVAVFLAIFCWVPTLYDRASTRLREQFRFLASPEPWLIFAATMFGNAGVFAWFSYIKPFMLNVSGFAESKMMLIMMLAGLGMVVGNLFSGKISGRYSPLRIAAMTDGVIAVTLLLIFAFGEHKVASLALALEIFEGLQDGSVAVALLDNACAGLGGYARLAEYLGGRARQTNVVILDCVMSGSELHGHCTKERIEALAARNGDIQWHEAASEGNAVLSLFPRGMVITGGSWIGDATVVKGTRSGRDDEINMERMERVLVTLRQMIIALR